LRPSADGAGSTGSLVIDAGAGARCRATRY
jgi:hypothetical protein